MYKIICTSDKRVKRRPITYEVWFYERPNEHTIDIDLRKEKIIPYGKYIYDIYWMPDV